MNSLSLALWAVPKGPSQNETVEAQNVPVEGEKRQLHINIWNIYEHHAIDIGLILPKSLFSNKQLNFFVPFNAKPDDFEDLSGKMKESDHKYLKAIFNRFFPVHPCEKNKRFCCVALEENTRFCLVPIEIEKVPFPELDGTVFTLSPVAFPECENSINYYVRFRIKSERIKSYYLHSKKESSRFKNITERVEILDVGYNVPRILPTNIEKHLQKDQQIPLDVIQFFYICPTSYKLEITKKEMTNMRSVEAGFWNDYFPHLSELDVKKDVALAYHRKTIPERGARLTHFSFLIKSSYQDFQKFKVVILFLSGCLISFALSYLAAALYNKWPLVVPPARETTQEAAKNNAITN